MIIRIQKHVVLIAAMLLIGCYALAQSEASPKKGFFADKPKKLNIELKVGRGFLGDMAGEEGSDARLFYGGGSMSYGLMLGKNFVGLGAGVEYVDLMEGSFDFPVFLNFQHYFSKDSEKGLFAGAKLGYMFGGKKSIPVVFDVYGEDVNGSIERSMQGLYGEVAVGYRLSGFTLFAAYNYRVISYETMLYPENALYGISYQTYTRVLHTVTAGVSFMLF